MGPLITLTTDFGEGSYVAQMKGVILSLCPDARMVEITHHVAAGDVREAAYLLECTVPAFAEDSVHIAVVDPGVGTDRRALAVRFARRTLVAPDNGLLTPFLEVADEVHEITEERLFLPEVSPTFHGRDIFAPVAVHLAGGELLATVGPALAGEPETRRSARRGRGRSRAARGPVRKPRDEFPLGGSARPPGCLPQWPGGGREEPRSDLW